MLTFSLQQRIFCIIFLVVVVVDVVEVVVDADVCTSATGVTTVPAESYQRDYNNCSFSNNYDVYGY